MVYMLGICETKSASNAILELYVEYIFLQNYVRNSHFQWMSVWLRIPTNIFRCVHAYLYEGLSVCGSVRGRSVVECLNKWANKLPERLPSPTAGIWGLWWIARGRSKSQRLPGEECNTFRCAESRRLRCRRSRSGKTRDRSSSLQNVRTMIKIMTR